MRFHPPNHTFTGELYHIGQTEFVREVSQASNDTDVIVHLYQHSVMACKVLNAALEQLARRQRAVKFVKIVATEAIRNWPDQNCPALLVYRKVCILSWFLQPLCVYGCVLDVVVCVCLVVFFGGFCFVGLVVVGEQGCCVFMFLFT